MDTPPWPPHQDSAASGDPAGSHPPQTPPPLTQGPGTPPEPVTYRLRFTGYGDEYFRIYFVNVLLTLITFGFYVPWARVRTRQYFYANTWLDGHPFEYLAKPRAILRGYLIVVAAALAHDLAGNYDPIYALVLTGVFFLIFPWIIYKTLRFKARYAAWRNIRFRFLGKLGGAYRVFFWLLLVMPFTLFLLVPYWSKKRMEYAFSNLALGDARPRFTGRTSFYYILTLKVALMMAAIISIPIFAVAATMYFTEGYKTHTPTSTILLNGTFILIMLGLYVLITSYTFARNMKYCLEHTKLGEIGFHCSIGVGKLIQIQLTNIFAIIFSFGLLAPWAKVRRARYILESVAIESPVDLETLAAVADSEVTPIGDAASEFLDLDFGF